jgi:Lar family restriction alleviation protein
VNAGDHEEETTWLLPCPFCGSEALDIMGGDMSSEFYVHCLSCFAIGPDDGTLSGAREVWNVRSD